MSKITGYAKQSEPKWLYGLALLLFLIIILFVIYGLGAILNRQEKKGLKNPIVKTIPSIALITSTTTNPTIVGKITLPQKPLPANLETKTEKKILSAGTGITVEKMGLTSKIDSQNLPVDVLEKVLLSQGRIYCYSRIAASQIPQTISHFWFDPEGNIFAAIKLSIHNQPADTWSYVNLTGGEKGEWRVEVRDDNNRMLSSISFLVE